MSEKQSDRDMERIIDLERELERLREALKLLADGRWNTWRGRRLSRKEALQLSERQFARAVLALSGQSEEQR